MQTVDHFMTLVINVDDVLIMRQIKNDTIALKKLLDATIKDFDYVKYFLDMEIIRSEARMVIIQHEHVIDRHPNNIITWS